MQLVYSPHEFEHWYKQGKISKPVKFDIITQTDTILLDPRQEVDLLFKFLTFRSASKTAKLSTHDTIVQRSIRILFRYNDEVI